MKALEKEIKIVKDEMMSGSARIIGTRIRVMDIVEKFIFLRYSPEEIAEAFNIPLSAVYEALSYYYKYPEEIREEIKSHDKFVKKFRKQLS